MKRSCKKCGEYIPHQVTIDGKTTNLSGRTNCIKCSPIGKRGKKTIKEVKKCLCCNNETKNDKFCSRNCSSSYNNRKPNRRTKKEYQCRECGKKLSKRKVVCDEHNPFIVDWTTITLGEMKKNRKYQGHSRIRNLARTNIEKSDRKKECQNCGYDKHYETCHIKAISSFTDDTFVSEINDDSNILILCPNCHWEFDNNKLRLNDILKA